MKCRYAIKLDHKGMANNASTMVSCLGLYLPVITTCGLVTNKEFKRESREHYADTVIMPEELYSSENKFGEVRPTLPSTEWICNIIENDRIYPERLFALGKLYNDKIFHCDNVINQLIKNVFLPLALGTDFSEDYQIKEYDEPISATSLIQRGIFSGSSIEEKAELCNPEQLDSISILNMMENFLTDLRSKQQSGQTLSAVEQKDLLELPEKIEKLQNQLGNKFS